MRVAGIWGGLVGTAALLAGAGAIAQEAVCGGDIVGAQRAESARYAVAWRTIPAPVPVGKHFAMELAVCSRGGAPAAEVLRVDARMPEHGHGMNYKATVKPLGAGRFRAEGLLFHMPGRWELVFEVPGAAAPDRVIGEIRLR